MGILSLSLLLIFIIIYFTLSKMIDVRHYRKGYDKGWEDCCKSHNNFEMSPDDELVLHIMKKALRSYLRNKKYIDKEALEEIQLIDNFRDFKHIVHYLAVYRKENIERE